MKGGVLSRRDNYEVSAAIGQRLKQMMYINVKHMEIEISGMEKKLFPYTDSRL